jgi:hypothetical protein
LHPLVRKQKQR